MSRERSADHRRLIGWLDDPDERRGVRFRQHDGSWQRLTYSELAEETLRAGATLAARGVRPGDVVPLVVPAGADFVTHFFGLLAIGATPSVFPLPWTRRDSHSYQDQLRAIAARLRPRHAIVAQIYCELVRDSLAEPGATPELLVPSREGQAQDAPRADSELAVVQFTSGSRGRPRGLRISVANMAANLRMIQQWTQVRDYGAVTWLPLYHDMGLVGCMLAVLTVQAEHAIMLPEHFLRDTGGWLAEYGRTPYASMAMPNFGFERVLAKVRPADLDGLDFSGLTAVISGAERVDPAVLARFLGLLEPHGLDRRALMPAYGLAEATLAVTGTSRLEVPRLVRATEIDRRLGEKIDVRSVAELDSEPVPDPWMWQVSCGRPMEGLQVEILDEAGARQPEGVLGEILVTGPSVAQGYVDAVEEDAQNLGGGRLHTGDAGFLLDGELYVVGRLGDSVKINGQTVFVEDIELELAASTPFTREHATVVAGMSGGVPTVLVIADRALGDAAGVLAVLRSFAGPAARTQVVQVRGGTIPFTSSRKPRRRALWLAYLAGDLQVKEL